MKCAYCSALFTPTRDWQKFCSTKCRRKIQSEQMTSHSYFKNRLPSVTVGAIAELVVSCDLLAKGYEVFRALSPAASCDLAILKNGELKRIQVRTAYRNSAGKLHYHRNGVHDVFALVVGGTEVIYQPPARFFMLLAH